MPHHLSDVQTNAGSAIVTGDPDRVLRLAGSVGTVRDTWARRGYVGAEVDVEGSTVLVCSTGIGSASTAIVVEELAQLGVGQVVRVGTCGSMQRGVRPGELVISSASVRDDGASREYLPAEFPATPDFRMLTALVGAAERRGVAFHVGVTHCKDAYYAEQPEMMPLGDELRSRWQALRAAGVLATEMEAAALFVVASVRRLRAGALLVPTDDTLGQEEALAALEEATRIAVEAALPLEADTTAELAG